MRNKITDGAALTGFVIIGLLVAFGVYTNTVYLIAGGLAVALLAGMFMAYPPRLAAMLFGMQIVFTSTFLGGFYTFVGPFRIGVDDILQLWIFFLWIGAFIDGDGRTGRTASGRLIILLVTLSIAAFFHGILAGYEAETAAIFLKTMLGYLFFFPAVKANS